MEQAKLIVGVIGALLGVATSLKGIDRRGTVTVLTILFLLWLAFIVVDIVAWCARPQTRTSAKAWVAAGGAVAAAIAIGWFAASVRKYQLGVSEPMPWGWGILTGVALLAYLVWEIVDNVNFDRWGNPRLRWYDGAYSIGAAICMMVVTVTWFWTFYDPVPPPGPQQARRDLRQSRETGTFKIKEAEQAASADGAGVTAFHSMSSSPAAPQLSYVVRRQRRGVPGDSSSLP